MDCSCSVQQAAAPLRRQPQLQLSAGGSQHPYKPTPFSSLRLPRSVCGGGLSEPNAVSEPPKKYNIKIRDNKRLRDMWLFSPLRASVGRSCSVQQAAAPLRRQPQRQLSAGGSQHPYKPTTFSSLPLPGPQWAAAAALNRPQPHCVASSNCSCQQAAASVPTNLRRFLPCRCR